MEASHPARILGHAKRIRRSPFEHHSVRETVLLSFLSIVLVATLAVGSPSVDTIKPFVQADAVSREPADSLIAGARVASHTAPTLLRRTVPALDGTLRRAFADAPLLQDTLPKRRSAVIYRDAYGTRATIHRRLSYTMLPLFAASYFTGDRLFKDGPEAPAWVRNTHRISATSVAVLFGVNAITGGWNLWEARHDADGRSRRLLHSGLFMAATAGFAYSGAVLADQAERSADKRREHRTVNLISMGLSTGSVLVMLLGRD